MLLTLFVSYDLNSLSMRLDTISDSRTKLLGLTTLKDFGGRNPPVLPYVHPLPITYNPSRAFCNDFLCCHNTSPCVEWVSPHLGLTKRAPYEVYHFEHSMDQRLWVLLNSPFLLYKKRKVEHPKVSKAHTSFIFRSTKLFPSNPCHFSLFFFFPPLEIAHHSFQILTQSFR